MGSRSVRTFESDFLGIEIKSKKKINSRTKGISNERECARLLEKWTGAPFSRVPSSGGLRWKNTVNACGDLICADQDFDFPFAVETKHLKDLTIPEQLRANSGIYKICGQAFADAQRAKKCPMLILRRNGMKKGEYVVFLPFCIATILPGSAEYFHVSTGKFNECDIFGYTSTVLLDFDFESIYALATQWNKLNYENNGTTE